jgi:SH3 domain-containing protein
MSSAARARAFGARGRATSFLFMRHPPLEMAAFLLTAACSGCATRAGPAPPRPARDSTRVRPVVVRDTVLEQRVARLDLRLLEKEAQVEELETRLDDARREVVRAMAKLQTLATRAEAASGMAEAEIALQALRTAAGPQAIPEAGQAGSLLQLAAAEFDKQNYGGALYLANQSKDLAAAGQGRLATVERGSLRAGEIPFALPLRLAATGRANVRQGPGATFPVVFTVDPGTPLTGYSYADQWVRIRADNGHVGWVFQGLIGRRP